MKTNRKKLQNDPASLVYKQLKKKLQKRRKKPVTFVPIDLTGELDQNGSSVKEVRPGEGAPASFSSSEDVFLLNGRSSSADDVQAINSPDAVDHKSETQADVMCSSSPQFAGTWCHTVDPLKDSLSSGILAFRWMVSPTDIETFFRKHWEKEPLYVKRNNSLYFNYLFSCEVFQKILASQFVQYGKNIDVTSYTGGVRETHNLEGRALPPVIWDYYNNGCSIRLLNPQSFHKPVWSFLSTLQEFFNSFCGANVYLTPPATQGFAPHWDDIEAFILQLEGKKRWRIYKPRVETEVLPLISSPNFNSDEIGQPIMDVVVEAGDTLYFPRGFIHQGEALEGAHSLHITVSTYQRNSWSDYLSILLPQALQAATENDALFREGIPLKSLDYMGGIHAEDVSDRRVNFTQKVVDLVTRMLEYAPIDSAMDQVGKKFIHDSLPPFLTKEEKSVTIFGSGDSWNVQKNCPEGLIRLNYDDSIRLIRGKCVRLIVEGDSFKLYHNMENSLEYHEREAQFMLLDPKYIEAVEKIISAYPKYVKVNDLPIDDIENKLVFANSLWEQGLLMASKPLQPT